MNTNAHEWADRKGHRRFYALFALLAVNHFNDELNRTFEQLALMGAPQPTS